MRLPVVTREHAKATASQQISDALDGRDLSFRDLVIVTGLTPASVVTGLYQLRQMGVLKTETLPRGRKRGRPLALYSVESAA